MKRMKYLIWNTTKLNQMNLELLKSCITETSGLTWEQVQAENKSRINVMCRSVFFKIASWDTDIRTIAKELKRHRTTLYRYKLTFEYDMATAEFSELYFKIEKLIYSKRTF